MLFFFFFKQKTAYDVRISDWSSDVCSSDLPSEMYGDNYGYRSGLNQSMVDHLANKARYLERLAMPEAGDVVLDIGSNDATTLKAYSINGLNRIGIDPTGRKFAEY